MDSEIIIIGGGMAGAALGKVLAEHGIRVLILERELAFKDRVRGEALVPWGVAEARALGIYEPLLQRCGQEIRWWDFSAEGSAVSRRDLSETTPARAGCLTFSHPAMQTVLLDLAEATGADVRRGIAVIGVTPGQPASVYVRQNGHDQKLRARLVIGADGRNSSVRSWGGFPVNHDPERLVVASTLHAGMQLPQDAVQVVANPPIGQTILVVPIGQQRFRSYLMYRKRGSHRHLSGSGQSAAFIQACLQTGVSETWYAGAELAGPLAEFEGADTWVDHPYHDGVVLVGDAAAASDPSFGQGLSLTLRDVRVLRDQLLMHDDWDTAAHVYAAEHDRYYSALHRIEAWMIDMFYEVGPAADARRARVLPRLAEEPDRDLDILAFGPDQPNDETARRRFFAED